MTEGSPQQQLVRPLKQLVTQQLLDASTAPGRVSQAIGAVSTAVPNASRAGSDASTAICNAYTACVDGSSLNVGRCARLAKLSQQLRAMTKRF